MSLLNIFINLAFKLTEITVKAMVSVIVALINGISAGFAGASGGQKVKWQKKRRR